MLWIDCSWGQRRSRCSGNTIEAAPVTRRTANDGGRVSDLTDMVAFRTDASTRLGIGHVMRCLALADRLTSIAIMSIFFCRELPEALKGRLERHGHRVHLFGDASTPAGEVAEIAQAIRELPNRPKTLVCDHYERDGTWQARLRDVVERLVVIDDLANRSHDCDLLVDPSVDRRPEDYSGLVPGEAIVLTGTRFAMLRPEFALLREQTTVEAAATVRSPPSRIVVSMGGSDEPNATGYVLTALDALEPAIRDTLHIDVVVGGGCPHVPKLREQADRLGLNITLHVDTEDLADILASSDLAFGASGGSSWERCCLGVPTITLVLADNQRYIAERLAGHGAVINLGTWPDISHESIRAAFLSLHGNTAALAEMRTAALAICDGQGTRRVVEAIVGYRMTSGQAIALRPALADDAETLFRFQSAPGARAHSRNPEPPSWEGHCAWFARRLSQSCSPFYMVMAGDVVVGMVRLDRRSADEEEYEVSILIDPAWHGQGLGLASLRLLRLRHPGLQIVANVSPKNRASQAVFRRAGYVKVSPDWYELRANSPGIGKRGAS
ncbi:UDP-2,4-diacetamido-2,4,6-trideoxy-beta-L-altropyranose hydrolase [Roseitalea porphyridii]|uniref:UDP-2,4-diacetamido-2,4, 6-trideoxy-beta-L-altropyranose hydrolase n=1 Tax=Roseitalea porphyridii TaxID=1852022 RepID=A0A4P6V264_9HYPH|nr:UDP-2,4-diacetamido-2,4,6-trideoxy-beta-L-altropyranose hydrolase [Roseitalea porphyridii]